MRKSLAEMPENVYQTISEDAAEPKGQARQFVLIAKKDPNTTHMVIAKYKVTVK